MKLNLAETLLVNNPVRALVQRCFEGPPLQRLGGRLDDARVIEVGCGKGVGTQILLAQFGAREVYAVDLDHRQVRRALRGAGPKAEGHLLLSVASVEQLPFADDSFDAVVDFGTLHHVLNWQAGVAEICRVLRPGGRIFFEEVTRAALNRWVYKTFLDHPAANRFSEAEFIAELAVHGVEMIGTVRRLLFNDIFIGVAKQKVDVCKYPQTDLA